MLLTTLRQNDCMIDGKKDGQGDRFIFGTKNIHKNSVINRVAYVAKLDALIIQVSN